MLTEDEAVLKFYSHSDPEKLIYQWVKQGCITLRQFRKFLSIAARIKERKEKKVKTSVRWENLQ